MSMRISMTKLAALVLLTASVLLLGAFAVHAQSTQQNQLRATIYSEIMADPRSQTMTQAQIYSMVNALTDQAQQQGITSTQLTYRPSTFSGAGSESLGTCSDISCALAHAFGLDGSIPIIPIALFVAAVLFILIYSIMREMGHPHAKA